jgi:hypothetical protein
MNAVTQMMEQRNIAALQKAITRTLSETYEVDTVLDEWMLNLLQQLEEDERGKMVHPTDPARSSQEEADQAPLSPLTHLPLLP